ncbi:MAG TPA: hypothetical protein DIT76_07355 [Spartobacteria bacterium]|nr:hypothetical protein [Spartobacteria bacterium]HCP91843.1 hypothetical protein [Spartobacteria bacterium]
MVNGLGSELVFQFDYRRIVSYRDLVKNIASARYSRRYWIYHPDFVTIENRSEAISETRHLASRRNSFNG